MKFYNTNSFKITRSILSLCFITFSWSSNAQISNPDVLHLTFNSPISSTGKIANLASNASKYADSADVLGLTLTNGGACFFFVSVRLIFCGPQIFKNKKAPNWGFGLQRVGDYLLRS